jgi:hypothetical protein
MMGLFDAEFGGGPPQGLSGTRHQPDSLFTTAFLEAFMSRAASELDEQVCQWGCIVYLGCHLSGLSVLLPCVSSMQALSTVLSSLSHLNLSLKAQDWQRLMHALLQVFKGGEVRVEAVTSVIWSGAVWGRLEDPSMLDVIKAIRTHAEQSPRLAAALGDVSIHQSLAQVR